MKASYAKAKTEQPWAIREICNGCGPRGIGWLVPDPNTQWVEAGNQHDWNYEVGGGLVDKWRADAIFYGNCFGAAVHDALWRWPLQLLMAPIYFIAVFGLGWFNFVWRKVPLTQEEMIALAEKRRSARKRG